MSKKFYRVLKDNFLWEKDAILQMAEGCNNGYLPINDVFCKIQNNDNKEYISKEIVENSPEWFERVYEVNLLSKVVYKGIAEAKEHFKSEFKS